MHSKQNDETIQFALDEVEYRCSRRKIDMDLLNFWIFLAKNNFSDQLENGMVLRLDPWSKKEVPEEYKEHMQSTQIDITFLHGEFVITRIQRRDVGKFPLYLLENEGLFNVELNEHMKKTYPPK